MRISDWSSDVCSSDLDKAFYHCFGCGAHGDAIRWMTDQRGLPFIDAVKELAQAAGMEMPAPDPRAAERSEERRVGKECVSTCRSRWSPYHYKQKQNKVTHYK